MCGIMGVHRFGEAPIDRATVDLLLLHNQNRGLEAAGVALQQADGSIQVCKQDVTPYQFIAGDLYKKFMKEYLLPDTVTVIGHTRKATQGDPKDNKNNHPMWAGVTAVVHNGMIHNDGTLFGQLHLERKAETDSDILRAILDEEGFDRKAISQMGKCNGNAAFAAISTKFPGKMLLGRSGNPIELAATTDHLMFSSEKGPLYQALRPYKQVFGIPMRNMTPRDYFMMGMNDNSAWLFSDQPREGNRDIEGNWLEWHQEMRIAYNWQPHTYMCHSQYHGARVKFYDDRPIDLIECPGCGLYLNVAPAQMKDLKKLTCGACGASLLPKKEKK